MEQVEVVVQSVGTDNVFPKVGQTVRVHYTCRVSWPPLNIRRHPVRACVRACVLPDASR